MPILDETHLAKINTALEQAKVAQQEIELAKRAGIPLQDQETKLQEAVTQLRKIKQVYFPNAA